MPRALQVHVNRGDHHDVSARTKRFVPEGPFEVHVTNHGEGSHVHVAVSGDLAIVDGLQDDNPFLEGGDTLVVAVDVTTDLRPARGTVEVTTGYGRNSASVDVEVREDGAGGADAAAGDAATAPTETTTAGGAVDADRSPTDRASSAAAALRDALPDGVAGTVSSLRERAPSLPSSTDAPGRDGAAANRSVGDDARAEAGASHGVAGLLPRPSLDVGTVLLLALTLLGLLVAATALELFSGPAITASVLAVVATVLVAGAYLLVR